MGQGAVGTTWLPPDNASSAVAVVWSADGGAWEGGKQRGAWQCLPQQELHAAIPHVLVLRHSANYLHRCYSTVGLVTAGRLT